MMLMIQRRFWLYNHSAAIARYGKLQPLALLPPTGAAQWMQHPSTKQNEPKSAHSGERATKDSSFAM